jgi:secreted PhoX family phosphatase
MSNDDYDHDHDTTNPSTNPTLDSLVRVRIFTRRHVLAGGLGAVGAWFTGCSETETGSPSPNTAPTPTSPSPTTTTSSPQPPTPQADAAPPAKPLALGFNAVSKGAADAVVVPAGYTATVLYRLGDPIATGVPDYANDGTDAAASYAQRSGDHHDGMHYFGLSANGQQHEPTSKDRALLVLNHEAITPQYLHVNGPTIVGTGAASARTVADEVIKEMNAHGVSVIEIQRTAGKWMYSKTSTKNRRITTFTPMDLSGPAAKTPSMITKYSTDGSKTRGTVNNCANGYTPWGTYLTCEENWAGYFRRLASDNAQRTAKELASFARYGITGNGRELWATVTADTADDVFGRWNAAKLGASANGSDDYRNVANTFGWVVEIDPFGSAASNPKKRTALGRFAHEGCWIGPVIPGKPVVFYMGCDGRNEYIYKFVSKESWSAADANGGLGAGDKYLDEGTLYVAKFDADGTGKWVELRFGVGNVTSANAAYAFSDQADVLINTRLAADAAGATKMDRPEWGAVNPKNGEVYFTLTNTNAASRPIDKLDPANPRFYNDPKGAAATAQKGNPNGHIIRMAPANSDHTATSFAWDIFLFGARAAADQATVNVSGLTAANDLSSPDGLWFSKAAPGLMWIQTDDGAYTDVTNCMLLAAIPGSVGDGGKKMITSVDGATTKAVETYVGKPPGEGSLRRFLTGPKECEITGIAESPDGTTLFVNIQHPGEETAANLALPSSFGSHWPDGANARPRSTTIAITRDDGGLIAV